MNKYIEQEVAIKALMNDAPEKVGYSREDAVDCIRYMDTADVAPVRHGRWEVGYFHDRVCSCCLHPDNDFDDYAHKFCPHCGAKMDGGKY